MKKNQLNKSRNIFKFVLFLLSALVKRVGVSRMLNFFSCTVFFMNWVTKYVFQQIWVLFEEEKNFGYVFGEILPKCIYRIIQFQEIGWER